MQSAHSPAYYRGQLSEHLPRTPEDQMSVPYWMGKLSHHLQQFIAAPSKSLLLPLVSALVEYRQAVAQGLPIDRTIPAPISRANTLAEWHRLQLGESMAMFRINPSEPRLLAMQRALTNYMEMVAQGVIKP